MNAILQWIRDISAAFLLVACVGLAFCPLPMLIEGYTWSEFVVPTPNVPARLRTESQWQMYHARNLRAATIVFVGVIAVAGPINWGVRRLQRWRDGRASRDYFPEISN